MLSFCHFGCFAWNWGSPFEVSFFPGNKVATAKRTSAIKSFVLTCEWCPQLGLVRLWQTAKMCAHFGEMMHHSTPLPLVSSFIWLGRFPLCSFFLLLWGADFLKSCTHCQHSLPCVLKAKAFPAFVVTFNMMQGLLRSLSL